MLAMKRKTQSTRYAMVRITKISPIYTEPGFSRRIFAILGKYRAQNAMNITNAMVSIPRTHFASAKYLKIKDISLIGSIFVKAVSRQQTKTVGLTRRKIGLA